jgi:hypothetical protein
MSRRRVLAVFVASLTLACSSPPEKERNQAAEAIAAARTAEAGTYAADELRAAETALQQYDQAVSDHDYRLALTHAIDARDGAYSATRLAGSRKEAAKAAAFKTLADFEATVNLAKSRLTGAPSLRPVGAAAERVRAAVQRAPKVLQEAGTQLAKQDFNGVVGLVAPMTEAIRRDLPSPPPPPGKKGK